MPKHREPPDTPLAAAITAVLMTGKHLSVMADEIGLNYKSLHAYYHGTRNPKSTAKRMIAGYLRKGVGELWPQEGDASEIQAAAPIGA